MRKKRVNKPEPDPLISELEKVEKRLQEWLAKSKGNAELFRRNPIAALRAADVDLEDDIVMELELIAASIARKLR